MNQRVMTIDRAALVVTFGIVDDRDAQFETQLASLIVRGYYNPITRELLVEAPVPNGEVRVFKAQITNWHTSKADVKVTLKEIENDIEEIWSNHEAILEAKIGLGTVTAKEDVWTIW